MIRPVTHSEPTPIASRLSDLRLGFVGDRAALYQDGLLLDSGVGRLISALRAEVKHLTVAMSGAPEKLPFLDTRLDLSADDFLPLPWLPSIARGFHQVRSCRRVIREVEKRSDVLVVQLPFAAPLALLGAKRPRLYHLCADVYAMSRTSTAYRGYRRLPAMLAGSTIDRIQRHLIYSSDARVITNGGELLDHYGRPQGRALVSTTILDREILSVPRCRPVGAPFRVLYVGYMRKAKGIDVLLDAFDQVLDRLPNAELVMVGPRDLTDHGMTAFLEERLARLSAKGSVQRLGHLPFGEPLFQCYADADLLALPSRSEGTPRVLVEARAFGCPVIGTRVGGIPTSITDGVDGLLVRSGDITELRDAILRVAGDAELRRRLIEGGIARARASTVESFVRSMSDELERLLKPPDGKSS